MRRYSFVGRTASRVKTFAAQEPEAGIFRAAQPRLRLKEGIGAFAGVANVLLLEGIVLLAILAIWYGAH